MMRKTSFGVLALLLGALAASCGSDDDGGGGGGASFPDNAQAAVEQYATHLHAAYVDSATSGRALDTAVRAFVADPSDATLSAAKQAWLDAREPYLQTEMARFYGGPIDDEDGPEGLLNAWPLDEVYIDYVVGEPNAGIVNDPSVEISEETLLELNEQGGEANVATGYHAIEFLLWGQDLSDTGPGARPFTDYTTADNAERRKLYLTTVSQLLVKHLDELVAEWQPSGPYRTEFVAANPKLGIERILTGMTILSGFETGGERLQVALDSGSQEDEHSCFSDNTHRDMVQDVRGVSNAWHGSYTQLDGTRVDGVGVRDVVAKADAELASEIDAQIAESLSLAEALAPPFDQEIASSNAAGRERVRALVVALRAQESLLQEVFTKLDLSIPADPE